MADINTKISAEYSAAVNKKFDENGGRLFLVDYSKSCALQALSQLFAKKQSDNLFVLVDDGEVCREFASVLSQTVGEITLIQSYQDFENLLAGICPKENVKSDVLMRKIASEFKARYPRVILSACDEQTGRELANYALCKNTSKSGVFSGEINKGLYCITDFIADCRYSFAVIDNVYGRISFEEANKKTKYDNVKFEKLNFLNHDYYAPISKSYNRLNNIIDGAESCVIMSDIIVERDVVNLYAVLELLYGDFPYLEAREIAKKITSNYEEDCERISSDVYFCVGDENVLSACLQKLKSSSLKVPSGIEELKENLESLLKFMSEEEIFLRASYAQITSKFNGQCSSLQMVIDSLENQESSDDMVNCIYNAFLKQTVKSQLESVLVTSRLREMSNEDISKMFEIFLKYGVYHPYPKKTDSCTILRLNRNDSGFEAFVKSQKQASENDGSYNYSVTNSGSMQLYKCVAIHRLLDGREDSSRKNSPMLVITKGNVEEVKETLLGIASDFNITTDINAVASNSVDEKTVVVVDYVLFRETALWLNVYSIVFFDVEPDAVVWKNLINKALRYKSAHVYILANYSDMSGHLIDTWQKDLLSTEQKAMPIDSSEISLKENSSISYADIISQLEEVYKLFEKMVSYGDRKMIAETAEKFNKAITDFTLKTSVSDSEINKDFVYLVAMSRYYNGIFKNSVSIDGLGEKVIVSKRKYLKMKGDKAVDGKNKKYFFTKEVVDTTEDRRIYFNVCAGMLRRLCDIKQKDCNGCDNYAKFLTNNYTSFSNNAKKLFEKSVEFAMKIESLKFEEGTIIYSEPSNSVDNLVLEEVQSYATEAEKSLAIIQSQSKKGVFSVEFEHVENIYLLAQNTYCKLLKKYYATLMDIFCQATEKAKFEFETLSKSFSKAHDEV